MDPGPKTRLMPTRVALAAEDPVGPYGQSPGPFLLAEASLSMLLRASLVASQCDGGRPQPIEQLASAFLLRVVGVLDLEPADT